MSSRHFLPSTEARRLATLRELMVLDSEREPLFDSITALASSICGAPMALISLVDAERVWFKASVGFGSMTQSPRDTSFCTHAVSGDDEEVFEIPDATEDSRFSRNPAVDTPGGVRFYAGAPLIMSGGEKIGVLCVIDLKARSLDEAQTATLKSLAELASKALSMRRDLISRTLAARSSYEEILAKSEAQHRAMVEDQSELVSLADADGKLLYLNPAFSLHVGLAPAELLGTPLSRCVEEYSREGLQDLIDEVVRTGQSCRGNFKSSDVFGNERWIAWRLSLQRNPQGQAIVHAVGRDVTDRMVLEQSVAAHERFVRQITDSLPVHVAYLDRERRYRFVNVAHCRRFNRERDEVLGRRRDELLDGASDEAFEARMEAALKGEPQRFEIDTRIDGKLRRVETQLMPDVSADGVVHGVFATGVDITWHSENAQALRELNDAQRRQAATLRSITESIPATVSVVGADGRYRFVNAAFARWRGQEPDAILGRSIEEIFEPQDYARTLPWLRKVLSGERVSYEKAYPDPNGEGPTRHIMLTYVPLHAETGEVDAFVSIAQDVTHHKIEERRLKRLSERDKLTGLLNRAGFERYLQNALAEVAQSQAYIALLYIDLDHFKPVNDNHGHDMGDELLKCFAGRLQKLVRPTDGVVRLGGDEFAIVLTGLRDAVGVAMVAEKVVAAAHAPFEFHGLSLRIGASVGYAIGADPQGGYANLVKRADAMLYAAKNAGRGRVMGEG